MGSREDGDTAAEHLDAAGSAQRAAIWPKVATDYHGALARLATMRGAKKQYLLFGYVELFPRDIPVPESFSAGDNPWAVPISVLIRPGLPNRRNISRNVSVGRRVTGR